MLALETVRYLANNNWAFTLAELEPIFRGEVAAPTRQDAPEILRITVPDAKERELIIRMTLAIGPFSQKDIEMVARVPSAIPLPGEVVKRVTGVWFQQVGPDHYLYSPLLGPTLADGSIPTHEEESISSSELVSFRAERSRRLMPSRL